MELLLETYRTILPIVTTSLMGYFVWSLQNIKKEEHQKLELDRIKVEANANGTRAILLYMLERMHTEHKMQKYVTHEQRTRFREIYQAYHDLGGNGYGTALWEDIQKLEIRNDVESVSPYAKLLREAMKNEGN